MQIRNPLCISEWNPEHIKYLNNLLCNNKDVIYKNIFKELSDYIKEVAEDDTNNHIYGLHTYISMVMESGDFEPN